MRVFLMANGEVGLKVTRALKDFGDEIVGLCLHEPSIRREGQAILEASGVEEENVFTGKQLRDPRCLKRIRELEPEVSLAAFWAYILREDFLAIAPRGTINMHPGYLPYCRGKNPNVWPFLEGSPAGVTIHYVDAGIDTGDIIARKKVEIRPHYNAGDLYEKTLVQIVELFKECWPSVQTGENDRIPQNTLTETPTFHLGKEVDALDCIDLNKEYVARDLINLLRARSYPRKAFAYYYDGDRKIRIRVQLEEDDTAPLPTSKPGSEKSQTK